MSAVSDLRRLLFKGAPQTVGKIVAVEGSVLHVTTNRGTVRLANTTATSFKEGDSVRLKGDVVLGKITDRQNLPVYHV